MNTLLSGTCCGLFPFDWFAVAAMDANRWGCQWGEGGAGRGSAAKSLLEGAHQGKIANTTCSTPSTVLASEEWTPEPQESSQYTREDYTVRKHWVRRIVTIMGLKGCAIIDTFASKLNARFDLWISKEQDAFKVPWPQGHIMWCNPPWSLLGKLPGKMQKEQKSCLVIMPAWHSQGWLATILQWSTKVIYFEKDSRIFEVDNHPCKGIRWGLYACFVPEVAFTTQVNVVVQHLGRSARRKLRRRRRRSEWASWKQAAAEGGNPHARDDGQDGFPAFGGSWEEQEEWWWEPQQAFPAQWHQQ